jgi:hypothetical protein
MHTSAYHLKRNRGTTHKAPLIVLSFPFDPIPGVQQREFVLVTDFLRKLNWP